MASEPLQGTAYRAEDKLEQLRQQIWADQFQDADKVRQFVNRYVTANPDEARSRSAPQIAELVGNIRSELGLAPSSRQELTSIVSDHVRDLVLGRAQASEDTARWAVHRCAQQVTMYSGQLVYDCEDVFIDGAGLDFVFRRTYKSHGFHNGPLGINWDHDYNLRLRVENDGMRLICLTGASQESVYARHGLYGGGPDYDYWIPPAGEHSVMFAAGHLVGRGVAALAGAANFAFVRRNPNGKLYCYEDDPGFPQRYRICRIQDHNSNYLQFSYKGSYNSDGERLWKVEVNSPSRVVFFDYDDDQGRLIKVTDFVGRTWHYDYDNYGDLIACTKPGGDRYPEALTERYVYSTATATGELQHKLLGVHDTAGRCVLENEYGSSSGLLSYGRIVRQRDGSCLRSFDYEDVTLVDGIPAGQPEAEEDLPAYQTMLTQGNGQRVHYIFNKFGNQIAREEDALAGATIRRLVAQYRYNRDGAVVGSVTPEGRITQYLYKRDLYMREAGDPAEDELPRDEGLDWHTRTAFGNRLAIVHRCSCSPVTSLTFPSPLRGLFGIVMNAGDVVVKFTYEADYQNVKSISHPNYTRSPFPNDPADTPQNNRQFARTLTCFEYDNTGRIGRILYPDVSQADGPLLTGIQEKFLAYDGQGRLKEYEDRAGTRYQRTYFQAPGTREGFLREEICDPCDPQSNPGGINLKTTYDINEVGAVTRITTPKGEKLDFEIDSLNRVITATRRLAPNITYATRYAYCRNLRVERIERDLQDHEGQPLLGGTEVEFFRYDDNDNVVQERRGGQDFGGHLVTRHGYEDGDLHTQTVLPRGNRIRVEYGERRLPNKITRGAGTSERTQVRVYYDGDGLLLGQKDGRGLRSTFQRDAFGRTIAIRKLDARGELVRLVRLDYDKAGNLTSERLFAPGGEPFNLLYQASHRYDELNQRIETRVRRFKDALACTEAQTRKKSDPVPAAKALRTLYFYDRAGRLVRVEHRGKRRASTGKLMAMETRLATTYEYNSVGWLVAETDPMGNRTETRYDDHGLVIRIDVREQVGAKFSATGEEVFSTIYEYDALDRLISATDGQGNRTTFEHDSRNALILRQDPLGNRVRFEYDIYGRQIAERVEMTDSGLGGGLRPPNSDIVTGYVYDPNGNLVQLVDAHGTLTHQVFDAIDRCIALRYADGSTFSYRYDGNGNVFLIQDANGLIRRTLFSPLDLPLRTDIDYSGLQPGQLVEGATFEEFEYDAFSRMTRARNDWADIRLKIDSLSHAYQEDVRFTNVPGTFTLKRDHDDFGFVTRLTHPSGRSVLYKPDSLNRVVRIQNADYGKCFPGNGALPSRRLLLANTYRGLRMGEKAYGNGTNIVYDYDARARVIGIRHYDPQHTALLRLQYLYDASGNTRLKYEYAADLAPYGELYRYDSRSQLTFYHQTDPPANPIDLALFAPPQLLPHGMPQPLRQAQMDACLGSLAQVPDEFTYRYDKLANRIEERLPKALPVIYVINFLNQVTQRSAGSYTYNANGSLSGEQTVDTRQFFYNHRNQLTRVSVGNSPITRYRHDALGHRIYSMDNSGETFYIYDRENVLEECRRQDVARALELSVQHVNEVGFDSRFQIAANGAEYWYHKDLIGSTRLLTTIAALCVARCRFEPFGEWSLPTQIPAEAHAYLYAGKSLIAGLQSYEMGARVYLPAGGRFAQRDAARAERCPNPYMYAHNNPCVWADPDGKKPIRVSEPYLNERSLSPGSYRILGNQAHALGHIVGNEAFRKHWVAVEAIAQEAEKRARTAMGYGVFSRWYGIDPQVQFGNLVHAEAENIFYSSEHGLYLLKQDWKATHSGLYGVDLFHDEWRLAFDLSGVTERSVNSHTKYTLPIRTGPHTVFVRASTPQGGPILKWGRKGPGILGFVAGVAAVALSRPANASPIDLVPETMASFVGGISSVATGEYEMHDLVRTNPVVRNHLIRDMRKALNEQGVAIVFRDRGRIKVGESYQYYIPKFDLYREDPQHGTQRLIPFRGKLLTESQLAAEMDRLAGRVTPE